MAENRTVTTRGRFDCIVRLWNSDTHKSVLAVTSSADNHHLYHPDRDPQKHDFTSKCPHEFRLHRQKTTVAGSQEVKDELVVHLSDSVRTMYDGWNMEWEFCIVRDRATEVIHRCVTTPHSDPVEWKTITLGNTKSICELFEDMHVARRIHFKIIWSREDPASELITLKRSMTQMRTKLFETFKSPSIEITRLVFDSKPSGTAKCLYVYSNVLERFEYFQKCHSPEYSETHHLDKSRDHEEGIYCGDPEEEWDSDSEDDYEPEKNTTFKATIHVANVSRRTYRAFIEYAICGALYFAPLRSAYEQYCQETSLADAESGQMQQQTSWPDWAEAHCTTHTDVPGCKTLTSPKSLYRLADMLIIPELKDICQKQIINSLEKSTVISELQSPLFEQHRELRLEAYKTMQNNRRSFSGSELVPLIRYLPVEEAIIVADYLLEDP